MCLCNVYNHKTNRQYFVLVCLWKEMRRYGHVHNLLSMHPISPPMSYTPSRHPSVPTISSPVDSRRSSFGRPRSVSRMSYSELCCLAAVQNIALNGFFLNDVQWWPDSVRSFCFGDQICDRPGLWQAVSRKTRAQLWLGEADRTSRYLLLVHCLSPYAFHYI